MAAKFESALHRYLTRKIGFEVNTNYIFQVTVPIDKIISVKNARAWVSMVSYLEQKINIKEKLKSSPILVEMGWIGCAILQATSKRLPGFFFSF